MRDGTIAATDRKQISDELEAKRRDGSPRATYFPVPTSGPTGVNVFVLAAVCADTGRACCVSERSSETGSQTVGQMCDCTVGERRGFKTRVELESNLTV